MRGFAAALSPYLTAFRFVATTAEDESGDRKIYEDHNLRVLFGVTLMAVLGVSSITPAQPEVRDAFGVTSGQVELLIMVFTLPGVALTPVLGVLSDRHGRKRILVPALLLFGVAGDCAPLPAASSCSWRSAWRRVWARRLWAP